MNKQSVIFSLAAIICSVASTVHAEEVAQAQPNVMFCTETDSNGFDYNQQQRRYQRSGIQPNRYTVNIIGAFESIRMTESGAQTAQAMQCRPSSLTRLAHVRECSDYAGYNFVYITQNNRFTYSRIFGYVYSDDGDTMMVSYGTCARF